MTLPAAVQALIERFEENRDTYRSPAYKEAQLRVEFLNPLFESLGWDVANRQGYAEAYKEVISEDSLRIAGDSKAPDYAFRIGGARKFFVEAKKPSVSLEKDAGPAYQLRRYAWSAKLPLSILTDFEEWAIYDTRIRPGHGEKASTARIQYFTVTDLPKHWDFLVATFSKEAILKGSFDKYAETKKGKRGTTTVDEAFLEEIEKWRDALARNLASRNPKLDQRELNFAVQRIIDRIIFLRICEDRGIEQYGRLSALVNGLHTYGRLCELFRRADERYNSGLFHFRKEKDREEAPDGLTLSLTLDDKVLKDILGGLYYPDSPYEFSVLPADILGQVYERFLGKVIRLTAGHQAKVEEKPEVKKAGGVYYTPTYIVDYIVKHTVGELVKDKTPKEVAGLRVLDPACGSGSFLIGAYQYLLDWHRDWYETDGPEKHRKALRPGPTGGHRLTTAERKRILLNNIYGVDIDQQAVEVTKLSLLLKVLEGETGETLQLILDMSHQRVLPDLGKNIKSGNSLIGPDFYDGRQLNVLGEENRYRRNVFDWNREFPQVFRGIHGGFDSVIGNPPYGIDYSEDEKAYYQTTYAYRKGKPESYIYFLERGVQLLATDGLLGFITPNAWLTNHYGSQIRRVVLDSTAVLDAVDLEPTRVFADATVDTVIVILQRTEHRLETQPRISRGTRDHSIIPLFTGDQAAWRADPELVINLNANPQEATLISKLESSGRVLGDIAEYSQGIIPYKTRDDGVANRYIAKRSRGALWGPLFESASQVRPYQTDTPTAFIKYGPWLWCSRDPRFFTQPKILFHRLRKKLPRQLVGAIDRSGAFNRHSLSNLVLLPGRPGEMLDAVLGIFNSKLANWWFVKRFGKLMEVGGFKVAGIPLSSTWESQYSSLADLVQKLEHATGTAGQPRTPHHNESRMRTKADLERRVDEIVYELYSLTKVEIDLVEGAPTE